MAKKFILDKSITNIEINEYFHSHGVDNFRGCYFKNRLPELNPREFCIINLGHDRGPGTHWVLLFRQNGKKLKYFDSYGSPPPSSVIKFTVDNSLQIERNDEDMQSMESQACGFFSMMVADLLNVGIKWPVIIGTDNKHRIFSRDPSRHNDNVLSTWFFEDRIIYII